MLPCRLSADNDLLTEVTSGLDEFNTEPGDVGPWVSRISLASVVLWVHEVRKRFPKQEAARALRAAKPSRSRRETVTLRGGRIGGIDGLRAIAVGLVLAYHLWPDLVPGGFVGVDVFFVLSGFLITTRLILELQSTDRIDLRAFWLRRARRLLPALVLVVVASTGVASLVERNLLVDIARQWVGAFTFSTNWVEIAAGTDYFAVNDEQLLSPLWSLAVEEQFYLVWPVAFTLMARRGLSAARSSAMVLAAGGASALLMAVLLGSPETATRVYYGADTHIFGLMIGASLAYQFANPDSMYHHQRWRHLRRWMGFVALALFAVVLTTLGSDSAWTYQGGLLTASVLTAITISALPGDRSALVRLLDWAPVRWIGVRSYGIYLWHWPVLLIVRHLLPPRAPGAGVDKQTAVLVLASTAVLAAASFQLVERPISRLGFRLAFDKWIGGLEVPTSDQLKHPMLRTLAMGGCAVVTVLAVIALATAPRITDAQRSVEEGQQLVSAQDPYQAVVITPSPAPSALPTQPIKNPAGPDPTPAPAPTALVIPTSASSSEEPSVGPTTPGEPANENVPPAPLPGNAQVAGQTTSGADMVGIGDSVMSGAAPALLERFPGMRLDAAASRQWDDAPEIVDRLLAQGQLRTTVVLNFGTNAGLIDEDHIEGLRSTIERIGPSRRIIVVTVVGISRWVPESNANLVRIAGTYPNVTVVDWHGAVQNDPTLVHSDRTHPNIQGIDVYAQLIEQAISTG